VVLGAAGTSSAVPSTAEKVAQGRSWAEKEQHLGIYHRAGLDLAPGFGHAERPLKITSEPNHIYI